MTHSIISVQTITVIAFSAIDNDFRANNNGLVNRDDDDLNVANKDFLERKKKSNQEIIDDTVVLLFVDEIRARASEINDFGHTIDFFLSMDAHSIRFAGGM